MSGVKQNQIYSVKIPSTVKVIGVEAFYHNTTLASVDLSEATGLESIKDQAFYSTGISEIVFPENLKTIGDSAFTGCTQLKKVILSEGVEEIGAGAFSGCKQLQSLTIPVSVTAIGNSLLSPRESLVIYYNGTEAQLKALLEKQPFWSNGEAVTFILADGTSVVEGAQ